MFWIILWALMGIAGSAIVNTIIFIINYDDLRVLTGIRYHSDFVMGWLSLCGLGVCLGAITLAIGVVVLITYILIDNKKR